MVKVTQETLDRMDPESRRKIQSLPDQVEEDPQPNSNGRVASSVADLIPHSTGRRYRQEKIIGIERKVRFRSLTARHFLAVSEEQDQNILKYSVCDANGDLFLTDEDLEELKGDEYDARTYMHLIAVANDHCLAGATLEGLTEAAAKN